MNVDTARFVRPMAASAKATLRTGRATPKFVIRMLDPKIDREIMIEIGERKVLEIRKHWMASLRALIKLGFATALLFFLFAWSPTWWLPWIGWYACAFLVVFLSLRASWRITDHFKDRTAITNQRILRVDGVVGSASAMVPLGRVTDITINQTWLGKIFNYGHFLFDNASKQPDLRMIKFVKDPKKRKRIVLMAMNGANPSAMITDPAEGNPIEEPGDGT